VQTAPAGAPQPHGEPADLHEQAAEPVSQTLSWVAYLFFFGVFLVWLITFILHPPFGLVMPVLLAPLYFLYNWHKVGARPAAPLPPACTHSAPPQENRTTLARDELLRYLSTGMFPTGLSIMVVEILIITLLYLFLTVRPAA
jgi:hypothetical protein